MGLRKIWGTSGLVLGWSGGCSGLALWFLSGAILDWLCDGQDQGALPRTILNHPIVNPEPT